MREPESCTVLYKILTPAELEAMPDSGWTGTALDLRDGFIHLSTADQLPGTLARFFGPSTYDEQLVYILPLRRPQIRADQRLQFDEAHGQRFGHLYDAIDPKAQFDEARKILRNGAGEWKLPELDF